MSSEHHESFLSETLRKKRLQSPGHIHSYIRVTSVSIVMISITSVIFLVSLAIWAFIGNVTDKAIYSGIVIPQDGVSDRFVNESGIVEKIMVHSGVEMKKGQVVAILNISGKDSVLTCEKDGTVLTAKVGGETFSPNEPIYSTVREQKEKLVLAFVDNEQQRDLTPGMKARIWPSDERPDDIGFFTGTIKSVANYPMSRASIQQQLRNGDLANSMLPPDPAVYEVVIAVDTDKKGNLHWSFGRPANVDVSVGTICSVMTETYRRSIVDYMFEKVRTNKNRIKQWVE